MIDTRLLFEALKTDKPYSVYIWNAIRKLHIKKFDIVYTKASRSRDRVSYFMSFNDWERVKGYLLNGM